MAVPAHIASAIVSPKAYADFSIYDAYKWLRANDPLGLVEHHRFEPFRVVTRYADVQKVSRQNDLFHNGPYSVLSPRASQQKIRELTGGKGSFVKTLVDMDPPEHALYRGLTAGWFQPANLSKLETDMRALARSMVEEMAQAGGKCDFVHQIALLYPLRVIMQILGLPAKDEAMMLKLTQEMFGSTDPELNQRGGGSFNMEVGDQEVDLTSLNEMVAYFNDLTEERRKNPTGDLASFIANGQINGEPMPYMETMGYYIITATAGHDTTSSSTGGAMWALAENPGEFRKLKDNPALLGSMLDEAIRWTTPVNNFMRTATADTEIAGTPIREGEWLMLCYGSANRDETVFDDPDSFRVDRKPNRHLAFGYGNHLCLGQYLARMEMRILFEELLPRLESVELDGEPAMSEAVFVNGPKRLPIRFTMN
ncbi:MAG: cytochrome P450 [Novosphingobium sp.]|nr:cytochrome P450 [Novosphingobium sp.]